MRQPGAMTLLPDAVISKRTGQHLALDSDELRALTVVIAEDYLNKGLHGASDVVSAAFEAKLMLDVIAAAGLKLVPADES